MSGPQRESSLRSDCPSPVMDYPGELFRPQASLRAVTPDVEIQSGLSGILCSMPSRQRDTSAQIKSMLMSLSDRQEELFRALLNQQQQLQRQISDMQLASKASVDVQLGLRQGQEALMTKFNEFSSKSQLVDMEAQAIKHEEALMAKLDEIACKAHACAPKGSQLADTEDHVVKAECKTYKPVDMTTDSKAMGNKIPVDVTADTTKESSNAMPIVMIADTSKDADTTNERLVDAEELDPDPKSGNATSPRSVCSRGPPRGASAQGSIFVTQKAKLYHESDNSFRARADRIMQSKGFEFAVAAAIMLNALVMCFEGQYHGLNVGFNLDYPGRKVQAHNVWVGATSAFSFFDWLFGILFFVEMFIKLVCWQHRYFYIPRSSLSRTRKKIQGEGLQGWNLLDLTCVLVFLFDKMVTVGAVNPQTLRLVRLFRLVRLVRLLRYLEQLDHLYVMTMALSGLKEVLAWAVVLITVMLMTCDLLLVQTLHATYFDQIKASDLTQDQLQRYHKMYKYFGTCTRCMISMYEVTLGDWTPVARLLAEEASEWFSLFCLAHKLTIGFAVIGVITGVILQETFKVAQTDDIILLRQKKLQQQTLRKKMEILFEELDESADGKIEEEEFERIAEIEELQNWLGSLGFETDDLKTLFALCDINRDGYITIEEMVQRMPRIQGNARSMDVMAMQELLQNFEKSNH